MGGAEVAGLAVSWANVAMGNIAKNAKAKKRLVDL
jgi:hypothetical protein